MANYAAVVAQIAIINLVFSIDSIVTAVGMANEIWIMAVAVILSMMVLMFASGPVATFVEAHPTVKILALGFLIMIGMALVADAFGAHVPKGYIYTAMVFSVFIELINMQQRRKAKPVHLRNPYGAETEAPATSAVRWRLPVCLALRGASTRNGGEPVTRQGSCSTCCERLNLLDVTAADPRQPLSHPVVSRGAASDRAAAERLPP